MLPATGMKPRAAGFHRNNTILPYWRSCRTAVLAALTEFVSHCSQQCHQYPNHPIHNRVHDFIPGGRCCQLGDIPGILTALVINECAVRSRIAAKSSFSSTTHCQCVQPVGRCGEAPHIRSRYPLRLPTAIRSRPTHSQHPPDGRWLWRSGSR